MTKLNQTNVAYLRSKKILEGTPERAMQFLRGLGYRPIRAALQRHGYSDNDHREGWRLLQRACGFKEGEEVPMSDDVSAAMAEIDSLDESLYTKARGALTRLHPEQAAFVFDNLKASTGMQSVMGMITFLERLDALENDPDRKSTRKADQAALATLEKRGITAEERKRIAKLVKQVKSSPDLELTDERAIAETEQQRVAAMGALRAWFEDWTGTARTAVTRRDHLIRLGLAKRKANGNIEDIGDDDGEEEERPAPTPAPVG